MRTFSFLILLLGAVASEPFFPTGQEYEFDYKGKLMSGIPELDSQFAGLTIEGKVILQAVGTETFRLAMKDVRSAKFNEKLTGTHSQNWRQLRTPEARQIPAEFASVLESPIEFTMVNGEVREVKVSQEEPLFAINFKKSLVSLMKIKVPTHQRDISENNVRSKDLFTPEWKTMEQGIDGKCENTYTTTEVPEYMLKEITFGLVEPERCQGKTIVQVLKTRDVTKCVERSAYQLTQPGRYLCNTGNCEGMWERSSVTRYIACGSNKENMELQVILNEGELQQSLMAYKTENVVTGTMQTLKMTTMRKTESPLPEVPSPRIIEDLFYEYPLEGHKTPKNSEERKQVLQNLPLTSKHLGLHMLTRDEEILSKLSPATLKQKVMHKLTEIVRNLKSVENIEEKYISSNVLSVSKLFTLLNTEDMKSLYKEVKEVSMEEKDKETMRQLVLEIITMTGTNPAFMFLKEMIESEEFSMVRTGVTLATLPHYIQTPSVKLLDQVFELIKSPAVTKHEMLKSNAELAFATLVNRACIDRNRVNRFPVFVYGEFCNSQTSELVSKYIPYFANQLQSAKNEREQISAILSLGTMGHKSVIQILIPYIEGKVRITPLVQRMTIYSLNTVTKQHRNILLPIYASLVHNPAEDRNVRMAALSMMLYMQPSMVYFQKIATSTWFEKDTEFNKFVFSTLKSLSEIEQRDQPSYQTVLFHNSNKAKMVLPLAKPVPGILSSTLNHFTAEWLRSLEVGYHMHGAYTFSGNVKEVYGKLEYFLENLKFTPIEFSVNMQGPGKFVSILEELYGSVSGDVHPELKSIVSALKIKTEEQTPFSAGIWTRLFDDVQVAYGVDAEKIKPVLRSIKNAISDSKSLKSRVCGKTPINFVKLNNWAPTEILIPSDMGLPIIMEFHMPAVLNVKGDIDVDCSGVLPTVSVSMSSKVSISNQGYVSTVCPFTHEVIAAGINQHWSVNYPTRMHARLEMGNLKVVYSPLEEVHQTSQAIDLWAYTVKPFTVIKPLVVFDVTPMIAHERTKIVRSETKEQTKIFPAVAQILGIDAKYVIKTETDVADMKTMIDFLSLYKFNPINLMLFRWTNTAMTSKGQPSCRNHEVKLVYNPRRSTTKEVEIELTTALAHKKQSEGPKAITLTSSSSQAIQIQAQELQQSVEKHQELQQVLQQIDIQSGIAFTSKLNIALKGDEPKTFTFIARGAHGRRGMEQKWNLHLENKERMSLCMNGDITLPPFAMKEETADTVFSYKNTIGYGKTCEEHKIKVVGSAAVSQDQKEKSRISRESRKCEDLTRRITQLREELRNTRDESKEYSRIEKEMLQLVEEKIEACRETIRQQSTLDHIRFKIEYTPVPEYMKPYTRMVDAGIKTVLLPYMYSLESEKTSRNEIDVEVKFNPDMKTFNMVLTTEEGKLRYRNIRVPERVRNVFPLVASKSLKQQVVKAIQGHSQPKCIIGESYVKSFDSKTYRYELDDCYHVLTQDKTSKLAYSVLGKEVDGKKEVKVLVLGSKIELKPSSSYRRDQKEYEIIVDGRKVQVLRNQREEVQSQNRRVTYRIYRSEDDVLVLVTPYNKITYDGESIEIQHTSWPLTGKVHGICGDFNGSKKSDILSAQSCVVKSIKAAALSFRIQQSCSALSSQLERIVQGEGKCQENQIEKISISRMLQAESEKCSQMKHSMIQQGDRLCISQVPIVECGSGCAPRSIIEKSVAFTCLPSSRRRVNKLYEEKVRRGDILPELRNMDKTFSAEMQLPVSCSHPAL